MRFQVPQFIEVEDKIFGPLTLKQFVYLAGAAGLSFIIYRFLTGFLPLFIIIILILPVMTFAVALAFYKPHEKQTFVQLVEAMVRYAFSNKLYLWRKVDRKIEPQKKVSAEAADIANYAGVMVPKISDSRLKDLTWSLDIKESMYTNKNQR